jgi:hypothetical protein
MEAAQKNLHPAWLYDGKPEYVDLSVGATSASQGGYVIALGLMDGTIRLAATRHPAKYLTAWRHNIKRYGLPDVARVLVSRPYLRYEAVKRKLASMLAEHKDEESDAYLLDVDRLTEKAEEVFSAAGM